MKKDPVFLKRYNNWIKKGFSSQFAFDEATGQPMHRYRDAIEMAEAHGAITKLEAMLLLQQAPACHTDATLMNVGYETANGGQFANQPELGNYYKAQAMKYGMKEQDFAGKIYMSQLCPLGKPGHPDAWIGGRGDLQALAARRGMGIDGYGLNIPMDNSVEPSPSVDIDPKLVEKYYRQELKKNPEAAVTPKEKAELRQKVRDKIKPHWSKT